MNIFCIQAKIQVILTEIKKDTISIFFLLRLAHFPEAILEFIQSLSFNDKSIENYDIYIE
jgi:hypothetical protein